jgi:hypothetical protein
VSIPRRTGISRLTLLKIGKYDELLMKREGELHVLILKVISNDAEGIFTGSTSFMKL